MKNWINIVAIFFSIQSFAASFGGQTQFVTLPVRGDLHLTCQSGGQMKTNWVTCSDLRLSPWEIGYFNAEKDVDANEVAIVSQRADGKKVEKTVGYNSAEGKSEKRVNLWIETLFQTALLDVGNNPISYELKKDGVVKASGQFNVEVKEGELKTCPDGDIYSFDMHDCDFPSTACDRYFNQYNWCQ